jgi:biopolymer transport protein ExbD
MKRKPTQEEAISGVNIIPVIDVTLVLLVILMVMTPVLNLPNIPVQLPEAMTRETKDENVTVSLGADGGISVDTQIVQWDSLPGKLQQMLKNRPANAVVIVRADKNLPYGTVENFLRTVNKYVGNRAVAIATQQRTQKLKVAP